MLIWAEIPKKAFSLYKLKCFLFSPFNYVSRKKLSINGKNNIYQQFALSVTMNATKFNSERFIIVPKQEDEGLHLQWRLTREEWLRANGIGLTDTEPIFFFLISWEFFSYRIECKLREVFQQIQPRLTTDYFLFKTYFHVAK